MRKEKGAKRYEQYHDKGSTPVRLSSGSTWRQAEKIDILNV